MTRHKALAAGEIAAMSHDLNMLLDTYLGGLFSNPHPWRVRQMQRRYLRRIGGFYD